MSAHRVNNLFLLRFFFAFKLKTEIYLTPNKLIKLNLIKKQEKKLKVFTSNAITYFEMKPNEYTVMKWK